MLLKMMTNLTTLSIRYSAPVPATDQQAIRAHLDAFDVCGVNLVRLSIRNTPLTCTEQFSWIISNILPRTPNLRHLELRQRVFLDRNRLPIHAPEDIQQVIHLVDFTDGVASELPTTLETVKWVARGVFLCRSIGLSVVGTLNVKTLFQLIPSLKVVVYHEGG